MLTLSPSEDWDMLEEGTQVVVGEIRPELLWARLLMSPYSDLAWGGLKVSAAMMLWPVVEEIGELEIMESLQPDMWGGWGATSAISHSDTAG